MRKRVNKREGIELLRLFRLPTVQMISSEELLNVTDEITEGLSVRLSPTRKFLSDFQDPTNERNVFLPSIHNCKDKDRIKAFIGEYSSKYNIFIHKTVKPELIGSASRLTTFTTSALIMETYKNFEDRKKGIIHNRMFMPVFRKQICGDGLRTDEKR